MSQRDLVLLVLANLNRMRGRVALTATGVLIGTAAIVVLISLAVGLQTSTEQEIGAFGDLTTIQVFPDVPLGIEDPTTAGRREVVLDSRALDEIGDLPHVVAITPRESVRGGVELKLGRDAAYSSVQGIDADAAPLLGWELVTGSPRLGRGQIVIGTKVFQSGGGRSYSGVAVGRTGAEPTPSPDDLQGRSLTAVFTKVDTETGATTQKNQRVRIAGVLAESGGSDDWQVYMALDEVEAINQWLTGTRRGPRDGYSQVLVKVDDRETVGEVQRAIRDLGFETFSSQDILKALNQVFLIMEAVLGAIGAVTLVVAAFGIANTMTMAIYERTREIGIMKAIGATNRDVLRIFLFEAGAIGVIGGLLGLLTGVGIGYAIDWFVSSQTQGPTGPSPDAETTRMVVTPIWLMVFSLGFATIVGLVSGIYPALRAASMKPLRALRTE